MRRTGGSLILNFKMLKLIYEILDRKAIPQYADQKAFLDFPKKMLSCKAFSFLRLPKESSLSFLKISRRRAAPAGLQ